jgi:hypothetical protein
MVGAAGPGVIGPAEARDLLDLHGRAGGSSGEYAGGSRRRYTSQMTPVARPGAIIIV